MDYLTEPYYPQQKNLSEIELEKLRIEGKFSRKEYYPSKEKFIVKSRYKANTRSSRPRMEI